MEPDITLRDRSDSPGPSPEDLALLASGQASDWLRAQFLATFHEHPDAVDAIALAGEPEMQAAVDEAEALLYGEEDASATPIRRQDPGKAKVVRVVPAPAELPPVPLPPVGREVTIRLRPNYSWLFLGLAAGLLSYLVEPMVVTFRILMGFFLVYFAQDIHATQPMTHLARARANGDQPLVEALLEQLGSSIDRTGTR